MTKKTKDGILFDEIAAKARLAKISYTELSKLNERLTTANRALTKENSKLRALVLELGGDLVE